MQLSTKLGFAGIAMLLLTGVVSVFAPYGPIAIVTAFSACALGGFAAERGTKWWLAVPASTVAAFLVVVFVAFRGI